VLAQLIEKVAELVHIHFLSCPKLWENLVGGILVG
jgi:hypothetical protein